jgi:phage-related holin
MIQENDKILGFSNFNDFFQCLLGLKNIFINSLFVIATTLTSFITDYVWDDAKAVYFLVFIITLDAITGIWKAIHYKTFRSAKLPRIFVIATIYVLMLSISWNSANFSSLFIWLPGAVYGGLLGTQLVSIYENLSELGYLPKGLFYDIIERIKFKIKKDDKNKD